MGEVVNLHRRITIEIDTTDLNVVLEDLIAAAAAISQTYIENLRRELEQVDGAVKGELTLEVRPSDKLRALLQQDGLVELEVVGTETLI